MKPEPISNLDAAILNVEDPTSPDTMGLLLLFNGKLDEAQLLERIEKGWLKYPRYRQRVRPRAFGRMEWVEDRNFDIRAHFRRVAVPSPNDMEALRRSVGEIMAMLLDRSKPLWTMHLIEGGPTGDALLLRVHHAVGDGMTLVKTGLTLFKDPPPVHRERKSLIDQLFEPLSDVLETSQQVTNWVRHQREHGLPTAGELLAGANHAMELGTKLFPLIQDPRTVLTEPLTRRKSIAWSPPVPTAEFKRVAQGFDVSINDLALALIAGTLRRYFIAQGEKVPTKLHASVPVYLSRTIKTGNNWGLVLVPLPLGEKDPRKRVAQIHRSMERLKDSREAMLSATLFNAAGRMPPSLVAPIFQEISRKVSVIVTNVPGPRNTLTLAGAELDHIVPLVPLSGHVGLGIAIASYNRKLSLGIQTDGERIKPNLRAFIELLRAELATLTALADAQTAETSLQCVAQTREGKRCRNRARKGFHTCATHRFLDEALRPQDPDPEPRPATARRKRAAAANSSRKREVKPVAEATDVQSESAPDSGDQDEAASPPVESPASAN